MTESELITLVTEEIKGLSSQFVVVDYKNAVSDAQRETWDLPQSTDFKIKWLKERTKRHLLSYLLDESVYKFKYKNISLGDRFKHLSTRVESMDEAFDKVQEEYVYEFAGVNSYEMFPNQIDSGFATQNQTGKDITYDEDQEVQVHPNENS